MEVLDEDLVEIDLNDDSSDDENQLLYEKNNPVKNNDKCGQNAISPLNEHSKNPEKNNGID